MISVKMDLISSIQAFLPHGIINSRRAYKDFVRLGIKKTKALEYSLSPSKVKALRFTNLWCLPHDSLTEMHYIVDLGAHVGKWSLDILSLCNPQKIFVIEPSPDLQPLLMNKLSHLPNVQLLNIAVSDKQGKAKFNLTSNQEFNSISVVKNEYEDQFDNLSKPVRIVDVQMDTLDNLLNKVPEISLLKIDVQGHELSVLKGAKMVLRKTKHIIIEINFIPLYENEEKFSIIHEILVESGFYLRNIVPSYLHDGRSFSGDAVYSQT